MPLAETGGSVGSQLPPWDAMTQSNLRSTRNTHWTVGGKAKPGFVDEATAMAGARWGETKYGVLMRTYRCPDCGLWHYGLSDRKRMRENPALEMELGRRVIFGLTDENYRNERERRMRLGRRFRGVGQR